MSLLKLMIAIPSGQEWSADFGMCLSKLSAYLGNPVPGYEGIEVSLKNKRGSILPNLRNAIVKDAQEWGATHLLFIDSDQTFPGELAHRLLSHRKKIVACNVATKCIPAYHTARTGSYRKSKEVTSLMKSVDLEAVRWVGCGIMLIDMKVFSRLPQPYFSLKYTPETGDHMGEDWYFCDLLSQAGFKVWVDHYLSRYIGHVGSYTYRLSDTKK